MRFHPALSRGQSSGWLTGLGAHAHDHHATSDSSSRMSSRVAGVLACSSIAGRLWWPPARMWKVIYWGALTPIRTEGFERLGRDEPAILMPNHESYLDVPARSRVAPSRSDS